METEAEGQVEGEMEIEVVEGVVDDDLQGGEGDQHYTHKSYVPIIIHNNFITTISPTDKAL